tara:strand:+ start:205 stop:879 length:675 start_codon:yes stop_codon:yes gene_type:complete
MDTLLYSKLSIEFEQYKQSLQHYKNIEEDKWYWDSYRTVHMLPLYTPGGAVSKQGSRNQKNSQLDWTEHADKYTREYFDDKIFPWCNPKGRIILLKTPPGGSLATHIDCNRQTFGTRQHKLRVVLQGTVDSLIFVTNQGEVKPKSDHRCAFIIDGSWPHYMTNTFTDWKYTICLGAPWDGKPTDGYTELLDTSEDSIELSRSQLPDDYEQYFEDPKEREIKFKT